MIFRAFKLYRDAKKGVVDPTGLVFDQMREMLLGAIIVPLIVFVAVLILLGLLGFTNVIAHASGVARTFFWILLVIGIIAGMPLAIIGMVVSKLLAKGEHMARPHVTKIKTKVEDVAQNAAKRLDIDNRF